MIKNKLIKIVVLNELGKQIATFGKFSINDIQKMINLAETLNMPCLAFIDIFQDTYFNDIQCQDIKKEIEILKQHDTTLNPTLLSSIQGATNKALTEEEYIKFEGI